MYWKSAAGFLAGFSVAITLVAELGTPHAYLVFVCGLLTRTLLALAVKQIYGTNLTTLWQRTYPLQVQMWKHAAGYITHKHPELDPLLCCLRPGTTP